MRIRFASLSISLFEIKETFVTEAVIIAMEDDARGVTCFLVIHSVVRKIHMFLNSFNSTTYFSLTQDAPCLVVVFSRHK